MSNITLSSGEVAPKSDQPKWKDEDYFNVLMPTYSGNAPVATLQNLEELLGEMRRPSRWIEAGRITGVATAKTIMFELARNQTHMSFFRGLILEDDIIIPRGAIPELVEHIKYADAQEPKLNIVTNIWIPGVGWSIFHKEMGENGKVRMKPYSDQELTNLPQYGQVELSGIGFYYGDIYANYRWHDGVCKHCTDPECDVGQDFAYYHDNNIKLSFFKLKQENRLLHRRTADY